MTHLFCRPQDIPRDYRVHGQSVTVSCCCRPRHRFTIQNTFFSLFLCTISASAPHIDASLLRYKQPIYINCTWQWIRQMPAQCSASRHQCSPLIMPLNQVKQSGDVHMPSGHSECSDSRMTCVSSIDKFCDFYLWVSVRQP